MVKISIYATTYNRLNFYEKLFGKFLAEAAQTPGMVWFDVDEDLYKRLIRIDQDVDAAINQMLDVVDCDMKV